jgi:glutamate synthase (ferredoxin)
MVFMPKENQVDFCKTTLKMLFKIKIRNFRMERVPVDASNLGQIAAEKEPTVKQVL